MPRRSGQDTSSVASSGVGITRVNTTGGARARQPPRLLRRFRQRRIDGGDELRIVGRGLRIEVLNHAPVTPNQVLGEIPARELARGLAELCVERRLALALLRLHFLEEREGYLVFRRAERAD